MSELHNKPHNREQLFKRDFRSELDTILLRPLEPETIDSYADDALNDVITLVGGVTEAYDASPTIGLSTRRETEEAAFAYHGMQDLEHVLDHLATTAEDIRSLDVLIANTPQLDQVITPPDSAAIQKNAGDGEFLPKGLIPRLKTTLFILAKDFGVDVHDPAQLLRLKGTVTEDMMRNESYFSLHVPSLARTIHLCDEEGNASFVFDSSLFEKYGIIAEDLLKLTKNNIAELLDTDPSVGRRIVYGQHFVKRMIAAIQDPSGLSRQSGDEGRDTELAPAKYLLPKQTEGYLSLTGIAQLWGVKHSKATNVVKQLQASGDLPADEELPLFKPKSGGRSSRYWTSDLENKALNLAIDKGLINLLEPAPEGYLSVNGISDLWGVSHTTTYKIIRELQASGDLPGNNELQEYNFGISSSYGWSSDLVNKALNLAIQKDPSQFVDKAPEGHLSANSIGEFWDVDRTVASRILRQLQVSGDLPSNDQLPQHRFGTKATHSWSPDLENKALNLAIAKGLIEFKD